jgi:hypothetical protein
MDEGAGAGTAGLIAFLTARIDEDEAVIRRNRGDVGLTDDSYFPDYRTYDDSDIDAAVDYLRRFTPPRMAREAEAKRALIDEHVAYYGGGPDGDWPVRVLTLLVAVYADHPDCLPEWQLAP